MSDGQTRIAGDIDISPGLGEFLAARKDVIVCWTYAAVITAAEVTVGYFSLTAGMIVHAVLLVAILVHSSLLGGTKQGKMILTLALAPLTRILSLSMPLGSLPVMYWYVIIGFPVFLAAFTVARLNGYRPGDIGVVPFKLPGQLLIAPLGVVLGFIEFMILRPTPLVSPVTPYNIWLPSLYLMVFTGFAEEYIFRGIMCKAFSDGVSERYSLVFVSCLFAVLHITHLRVLDIFFVFAVALLFTYIFRRTGSLAGIALAHGVTNIFLYIIWPNYIK